MKKLHKLQDQRTAKQIFIDEMHNFTIKDKKDIEAFLKYIQVQFSITVRFTK